MRRVFRRLNIDERDLDEFSTSKDALFNYNDKRIPLKGARLKGDGEETEPVTIYSNEIFSRLSSRRLSRCDGSRSSAHVIENSSPMDYYTRRTISSGSRRLSSFEISKKEGVRRNSDKRKRFFSKHFHEEQTIGDRTPSRKSRTRKEQKGRAHHNT